MAEFTWWRIVPLATNTAAMNMAIDEAVMETVGAGRAPPTIRFYRWKPSAVSIGCFQSLNDEVRTDVATKQGIDIVRRRTGGGAVYHDYDGEITYSVIGKETLFSKGITESYHEICGWIIKGLAHLGIKAEFKPINDIVVNNKKISGNAQTRRNGVLLQHGTILHDLDVNKMFSVLNVSQEKIADKMIQAVEDRVTRVKDVVPQATLTDTYNALLKGFTEGKEQRFALLIKDELARAQNLAKKRYSTKTWTGSR
ncbi:MAG: lipoate--protein ligase family protein [Nanoarchaeota archaeon]|nr:lipoate--protein ligase family protein [Nanoarchaeota archaeon]